MDDGSQKLLDVIDDPTALETFLGISAGAERGSERSTLESIVDSLQQGFLEVAGSRQGGASVAGGPLLLTQQQLQQLHQLQVQQLQQQQHHHHHHHHQTSISSRPQAVTFTLPHTAVSSSGSTVPSSASASIPVSTHHFVLTPFSHQAPSSSQTVVVSSSQPHSFIYTPVTSTSSSSSGITIGPPGISIGHSGAVISSSNIPVSNSSSGLSLGTSGIQIGSSGMPVGSSGIAIGPSGISLGPSALSSIPVSSSSVSGASGTNSIFCNNGIPVGSTGLSGVLVGPSGAVFPPSGIPLSAPANTISSPGSPFSVPTRSPHAPPTPSPSPLPLRSPASVPAHPPSPAPSPYHSQLQSPQNPATGFILSTSNTTGNLMKDAFTNLPLKNLQASNSSSTQSTSNYVLSSTSTGNSFKDAFGNIQQQASSVVVLPQRSIGSGNNSIQISPQNTNSPSSYSSLHSPQSIILSQSASQQTCTGSSNLSQNQSNLLPHSNKTVQPTNASSLNQHNVQSTNVNQHISSNIQSPLSSTQTRSPAPTGGALTPAPSPSPQHRTVPSPVIRSTTPTPVIHQTLPAGLAISGGQQFPVMSQGGTAVLQTTNHQLVQIIHQSAAVPGTNYPSHAQIIATGGPGAPVHLHTAAAAAAKPKQPPQILPKPPGTSSLSQSVKLPSSNRTNIGTATQHQGLHPHHGSAGTQVVIGQANQAAMIPTAPAGTLLLNQVIPGLSSAAPVLVQPNAGSGVQFILRPPTPGSQTSTVAQASQNKNPPTHAGAPVLLSGHGGTQLLHATNRQTTVSQQQPHQQPQQQGTPQQSQHQSQQQQILRLFAAQGTVQLQQIQTPSGPTFIAVPSGPTLSFQHLPQLATPQQTQSQAPSSSKLSNTSMPLQTQNNIIPAVLNSIQHPLPQNSSRANISNTPSVTNLNVNVQNLSLNVTNSNSTTCSHNTTVLGESLTFHGSTSIQQNTNHIPDSSVGNSIIENSGINQSNMGALQTTNQETSKVNTVNNCTSPRDGASTHMVMSVTLPPPKKKPKKKKKKKKLDLANIMKLSGIGDEDDMGIYDSEEQPPQLSPINRNHSSTDSPQSNSSNSSQLVSHIQSPPQIPIQGLCSTAANTSASILLQNLGGQPGHALQGIHQNSIAAAHSQLTALLAAHGGAGGAAISNSNSQENQHHVVLSQLLQQTPPSSSPHLVSTGTNTTSTRQTSNSVSPTSLSSSQANPSQFITTTYASNSSQNANVSSTERYGVVKTVSNYTRDAFTDVPLLQQPTKALGKVDGNSNTNGNPVPYGSLSCKTSSGDLKDVFINVPVTSTIIGKPGSTVGSDVCSSMTQTSVIGSVVPGICTTQMTSPVQSSNTSTNTPNIMCRNTGSNTNLITGAYISSSSVNPGRNCSQIDTLKCTSVVSTSGTSKITYTTATSKISNTSPSNNLSSFQQNLITGVERIVMGNSTTTQTDNSDIPSMPTTQLQLQSAKLSDNQATFLPVSSATNLQNSYGSVKSTFASVDGTQAFLGLHSFQNLQGLVSSTTNMPLMATLPPITSNAPSGSSFGPSMTYTGTEPLVIAHPGGISSVIAGPQLLQCLQQAQGQPAGLINMSSLQLTQNALNKVLGGSTSGLAFNTGTGTILIGSNTVENFNSTNQQKSTPTVVSNNKFIPQQSVLLQQLNSGVRRCSSDSNSSISLGSPPPVIGVINQQISTQQGQITNQTTRKSQSQQSIETQTISIGVHNSLQNAPNVISGLQNTFIESITQTHPNLIVNKLNKPVVQYSGLTNVPPNVNTVKKKKKKCDRIGTKMVSPVTVTSAATHTASTMTNPTSVSSVQIQNNNHISSSESVKAVLQERLITKSVSGQTQNQPMLNVGSIKSSSEISSSSFGLIGCIRSGSVPVPPLTSVGSAAHPVNQSQQSSTFCQQTSSITSANSSLTSVPIVSFTSNTNKITVQHMGPLPGNIHNQGNHNIPTSRSVTTVHQTSSALQTDPILPQPMPSSVSTLVTQGNHGVVVTAPMVTQGKLSTNQPSIVHQLSDLGSTANPNKIVTLQQQSHASVIPQSPQVHSNNSHLNPALPHLVPIPPNSMAGNPGSSQGMATIGGLQSSSVGGAGLLPGSIIQKVHTIQLTPQNQKHLKAVQMQIQSIIAKKSGVQNDQMYQRLIEEQQRILSTGKVVPTIPGQHAQGLQFVGTQTTEPPGNLLPPCSISPKAQGGKLQSAATSTVFMNNSNKIQNVYSSNVTKVASPGSPPRGVKRPATSPLRSTISRSDLIEHQLKTDQTGASMPDTQTPFSSTNDACKRLIRYHVYNEQVLSQQDLEKADEIFEATAKHLLDKFRQMMNKYRCLLLMESMREVNTAELIMIGRMFVAEEHAILEKLREDQKAKEEPVSTTDSQVPDIGLSQQSYPHIASQSTDLRVVQDVKNDSIKRELEEDRKFTVVKKEKTDFDVAHQDESSKPDQTYDEWEEIQKALGVFCPSTPSVSVPTLPAEVKYERSDNISKPSQIKVENDLVSKHFGNLSCTNMDFTSGSLKFESPANHLEVIHKSTCLSSSHGIHNSDEDMMSRSAGQKLACESSEDAEWTKKFPISVGGVKNRSGIGGPRDEGGGDMEINRYLVDRKDVCDSATLLHKKKRHKPNSCVVSEDFETISHIIKSSEQGYNEDSVDEEEEENDALHAQVQSAIDSILNLQRSEDGFELPSGTVNTGGDISVLELNADDSQHNSLKKTELENRSRKVRKCLKLGERITGSVLNSHVTSPVDYGDEVDHFPGKNSEIITNGESVDEDSNGNGDSALDEAVRSILTS